MATPEEIKESLEKWIKLMEKPEVKEEFEGFNKTLQFIFPDIDYHLKMIFKDQAATLMDGYDKDAEMSLEINSDLFTGICKGDVDPMEVFMEGELKIKGDMNAIQRLEIFMEFE